MRVFCGIAVMGFGLAAWAAGPAVDFIHVSDVHMADFSGVRPELAKMRARADAGDETLRDTLQRFAAPPRPAFVLLTGDIVDAWCFDGANGRPVHGQIRLFKSVHDASRIPLYLAMGNHDIECYRYQEGKPGPIGDQSVAGEARRDWTKTFRSLRDGTYYSFRKKAGRTGYRFLVLDNADGGRDERFAEKQLAWVRERIRKAGDDRVILAMHVPAGDRPFFAKLKEAIAGNPRVALLLAGHQHTDRIDEVDVGGRKVVQALAPGLRAGMGNWRRIRLYEDRIEIFAAGEGDRVVRTIAVQ